MKTHIHQVPSNTLQERPDALFIATVSAVNVVITQHKILVNLLSSTPYLDAKTQWLKFLSFVILNGAMYSRQF